MLRNNVISQHMNNNIKTIFLSKSNCVMCCVLLCSLCHHVMARFTPPHGFPPSLGGGLLFKDPLGLKEKPSDAPRPKAPTTRVVRLTTGQLIDYDYPKPDFLS